MRTRLMLLAVAMGMVAAACGGGAETVDTTTATAAATTESTTTTTTTSTPDDLVIPAGELDESTDGDGQDPSGSDGTSADDTTTTTVGVVTASAGAGTTLRSTVLGDGAAVPTSARFDAVMSMVGDLGSGESSEISFTMGGAYDTDAESYSMSIDFASAIAAAAEAEGEEIPAEFVAMFEDPMQIIAIGDTAWIKSGFFLMFAGDAGEIGWIEMESDQAGDVSGSFGFETAGAPDAFLDQIADATGDIVEIGTDDVRGVTTTHYQAILDVEAYARTLSADERAELESDLGDGVGLPEDLVVDLWIGVDDGYLYRYQMDLTGSTDDPAVESASIVFEIYDYNQDVGIVPPPANEILTEDQLGGLFEGFLDGMGN